jgi:hypothetical protein
VNIGAACATTHEVRAELDPNITPKIKQDILERN